ncbi:hypothetical protein DPMN_010674 [Dreissena polymorpha]|uniref:Uncharacterized protein n=1 Tax=Dreissena polymorpha TaxID=45954 RepID=A0A9D4N4M7_DREPO|nr:hypothetical protein DPMN_010674 [Dreissena polymorpha]
MLRCIRAECSDVGSIEYTSVVCVECPTLCSAEYSACRYTECCPERSSVARLYVPLSAMSRAHLCVPLCARLYYPISVLLIA